MGNSKNDKISKNRKQFENLLFAFNICRHVKSNAIVLASNGSTIGIGSGQPSRLDSCQIAINKMKKFKSDKNLVLVTHYVLISEILNYGPSSGEIVVSNRNLNIIGSLEINY